MCIRDRRAPLDETSVALLESAARWPAEKEALVGMLALESRAAADAIARAEQSAAVASELRLQLQLATARTERARDGGSTSVAARVPLGDGVRLPDGVAIVAALDEAEEGLERALINYAERARLHERARDGLGAAGAALDEIARQLDELCAATERAEAEPRASAGPVVGPCLLYTSPSPRD